MDLNKSIRMAVDSGKVILGAGQSVKAALRGQAKLVIIAKNCPETVKADFLHYCKLSKIPVLSYTGTSLDLGTVCGKPFPVSVMSVLEAGDSDVLKAV